MPFSVPAPAPASRELSCDKLPDNNDMAKQGALEEWATWLFSPTWSAILVAIAVAVSFPIIFHWFLYRKSSAKELPSFLLVGPSGSGKTSLFTLVCTGDLESLAFGLQKYSLRMAARPRHIPPKNRKTLSANYPPRSDHRRTSIDLRMTTPLETNRNFCSSIRPGMES